MGHKGPDPILPVRLMPKTTPAGTSCSPSPPPPCARAYERLRSGGPLFPRVTQCRGFSWKLLSHYSKY